MEENMNTKYIIELTSVRNNQVRYLKAQQKKRIVSTRHASHARTFATQEQAANFVRDNAAHYLVSFNVKQIGA